MKLKQKQKQKQKQKRTDMSARDVGRGFTILNLVVWLGIASLLAVFIPHAYSVLQAKGEPQRVALMADEPLGEICHTKNPDSE
jgi:type II secretory pathway component PulJ